jgi:CHAD domain-containing protein
VLALTLDELVDGDGLAEDDVREFRRLLSERHEENLLGLRTDIDGRAGATALLANLDDRIRRFPAPPEYATRDLAALEVAIKRSYRRGRKGMEKAELDDSVHAFHEWRKQVKYLRYQLEALSGACSPTVAELVDDLDALSELLGAEHDLADLSDVSEQLPAGLPPEGLALIDRRSAALRERCLELGARLFAQKSGDFVHFFSEQSRTR